MKDHQSLLDIWFTNNLKLFHQDFFMSFKLFIFTM
jgi:hypothetical protein